MNSELSTNSGDIFQLKSVLSEAAKKLSLPVGQWEWQEQIEKLEQTANREMLFELAQKYLGIELFPCSEEHNAVNKGLYVAFEEQTGWSLLTVHSNKIKNEKNVKLDKLPKETWRVLLTERKNKLSWRSLLVMGQKENRIISRLFWTTLIINLFIMLIPLYLNAIYDRVIPGQADSSLWTLSLGVMLAILVEYYFRMDRIKLGCEYSSLVQYRLEPKIISELIQVMPSFKTQWGRKVIEAMNNWNVFRMQFLTFFSSTVLDLVFSLLYFIVIAIVAGWLIVVPIFIFICAIVRITLFYFENKSIPTINAQVPFSPTTLEYYQSSVSYKEATYTFLAGNEKAQQNEQKRYIIHNRCSSFLMGLTSLQTVLAVIVAFYLIQTGHMSPAGLFATIIIGGRLSQPFFSLMHMLPNLERMTNSMKQINALLDKEQNENGLLSGFNGPKNGWGASKVSFKYHPSLPCLDDISLQIKSGERIAIVGGPGSGKSTLLKLLLGILEADEGNITWNGFMLTKSIADSLRSETHYLWQYSGIIGETVYEYLTLNNKPDQISHDRALEVLKQVNLQNLLPFLNNGLDTYWRQLPVPLTILQRQKLALARFILSPHSISFLDNPSAELDPNTEQLLLAQLDLRAKQGQTMIIATDRTNLLSFVDRVIMLNGGNIVFDGNKQDFQQYLQKTAQDK